jgi:GAF domain-containing protein
MANDEKDFKLQQLEAENRIARAISKLFDLENILRKACDEIKSNFDFDFVSISLVFLNRNTIEAVYGIGIAEEWANQARHYIEEDEELRDIQADIVKTCRTEIITGYDNRFDEGVYTKFAHDEFTRIFTPILLVRDTNGDVVENWFNNYDWKSNFITSKSENQNSNYSIHMNPSGIASHKVIGTIEAGYKNRNSGITYTQALSLAKLSAEIALKIREARLRYVLELIAKNTKEILRADSVTLHFLLNPDQNKYMYQVRSDNMNDSDPEKFTPRLDEKGVGWRAIKEKQAIYIDSSKEDQINPKAYKKGSRSCAVFPLILGQRKNNIFYQASPNPTLQNSEMLDLNVGVIYVHYKNSRCFSDEEKKTCHFIVEQAVNAIWQATTYQQGRDKAKHLSALHSVTQSINQIPVNNDILKYIAWNTLNALASDVVTIYSYVQTEEQFITPPSIAGRLKSKKDMDKVIIRGDIPFMILERLQNNERNFTCTSDAKNDELFKNSPFCTRENIQSLASVLLKIDDDIVGIMFINYRRKHVFSIEDEQIIKTLAASAAAAIKNQRWLQHLSEIEKKIITTLTPKVIDIIIKRAVQITGANLGVILQLEPIDQNFELLALYPDKDDVRIANVENIGETTIRKVIKTKKSALVADTKKSNPDSTYFVDTTSQICVPLLSTDGKQDIVIGIINVERKQKTFTSMDLQKLEVLADLAVIAIQNVRNNERIGNMLLMSTVGELTGQLLHQTKPKIGALGYYLDDVNKIILELNNQEGKEKTEKMRGILDNLLNSLQQLKMPKLENIQDQNVNEIINEIISKEIKIPSTIEFSNKIKSSFQVLAGKQQLIAIISNVLQNAIDSMQNGGVLSIQAEKIVRTKQNYIRIKIKDNGLGMSEDYVKTITGMGVTTKKELGNMGFGLWFTNLHIENLGGKLNILSKFREGTEVIITLPEPMNE